MSQSKSRDPDVLHRHLRDVQELLSRQRLVDELVHRQQMPHRDLVESITHKQNLARLQRKLDRLHPADIAWILETLPLADRLFVWELVRADKDGDILLEVSDAVRASLLETMDHYALKAMALGLDADELADLAPDLPAEVVQAVLAALDQDEQAHVRAAMSYPEGTVGALMDFDLIKVREQVTLGAVLRYLRRFGALPDHTDKLFVVDREERFRGLLTLESLLVNAPERTVSEVMKSRAVVTFRPDDDARAAAQAFERYDLVSVPVVSERDRVIGRLTVDDMVDYIREESEAEILGNVGLREEEDLFAPVIRSVKNRWAWLAVNLITAFVASRVIDLFQDSIGQLVALAALMPIVAGIGGNAGNQTITMIVRAIAMGQVESAALGRLLRKELGVALINGLVWGGVIGVLAGVLYGSPGLGLVMIAAMTLNLLLAATAGVLIPLLRQRFGGDPALGSSVLITALTDSGGFFIFLGLATLLLL
ncbi:magnesium transporter [Marichromatium purpuratum 984]|uniref:Magnesium transporter MgtE n=1 Tax=Marichromatium purpuratum 984 TaxID=765910 RepID=W0E5A2_MARPU|nr:magnesium transporter [Marichromatium purpuratum]AHF04226.1 magnesium transporter [Marichromatium purpuratum 984]